MANDVFNIAEDVDVAIFTYNSNVMVWDVSRWDEDNWSSTSEEPTWQSIACDVASVITSNGVTVQQGLTAPEPATATIVYQSADYDPFTNNQVRSGTPVVVNVRPNPDTAPSTWVTLFRGKIDSASASYNYDWTNTITLECVTELRDYLNFTSTTGLTTTDPALSGEYIPAMNTAYGSSFLASTTVPGIQGYPLEGISSIDPVEFGTLLNQLLVSNLGAIAYLPVTYGGEYHYFYNWDELEGRFDDPGGVTVEFESAPSANPLRAEFSNITLGFDTAEVVNTVNFTTTLGYSNTVENAAAIELMGNLAVDLETLHYYDADADDWASRISLGLPQRRVQNIEAPVLYRSGQVNENLLRDPFDIARVTANNSKIVIDEKYYITRITHEISPTSWTAFYDLWKGL